ncbi:MAG TPA: hypothetical protein VKB47_16965 [Terracidiphilus sp.]|nr:hypothetical protein [Terracidiphilus sp.]
MPLAPGCTPKNALTGKSGAFYDPRNNTGAALKTECFNVPLVTPGEMGVPAGDTFETNFISGQRNIFRQSWQKCADASLVKDFAIREGLSLHYTFDVYNVTNTASFDIPQNNVNQNYAFNNVPIANQLLYNAPVGLGIVKHTIGSPRQIQMSLHLNF